ncbi:hypothetical protein LPJ61_000729 [Coemansia biformis]|uniref:Uncharacterized protein n=1 Tax=Coemansia biformis TaxID=1286918 RepID=A0A9W8D1C5_9FUNG|nr:hypothetical protein LPJ61_000729 [Coemansia biformis]
MPRHSKRDAAGGATAGPEGSKRARTGTGESGVAHVDTCDDGECTGCVAGAVQLDSDVLGLPASELLAAAEQEEAEGTDRGVVTRLYEAALAKFDGEQSLPHAWALLRLAEYVDYCEYSRQALSVADKAAADGASSDSRAQALVIKGRARVLEACLNQDNWSDPRDYEGDEGSSSDEDARQQIAGKEELQRGLDELAEGLRLLGNTGAGARIAAGTVVSLTARHARHSLVGELRLATMDSALALACRCLGWAQDGSGDSADGAGREPGAGSTAQEAAAADANLALAACKAAVYWALAASERAVDGSDIETKTRPAAAYLEASDADAECCKLHAQILIVLSGTLDDEDAAIKAFDAAVAALERARQLNPGDMDVVSQLEDLGVGV